MQVAEADVNDVCLIFNYFTAFSRHTLSSTRQVTGKSTRGIACSQATGRTVKRRNEAYWILPQDRIAIYHGPFCPGEPTIIPGQLYPTPLFLFCLFVFLLLLLFFFGGGGGGFMQPSPKGGKANWLSRETKTIHFYWFKCVRWWSSGGINRKMCLLKTCFYTHSSARLLKNV